MASRGNFALRLLKVLLILAVVAAAAFYVVCLMPFGPSSEVFVDIAPGTSTAGMAEQLQHAGIIRSALAFEAMKQVHGGVLKAGEYRFDQPAPLADVFSRIRRGDVYTVSVTIPEGFDLFEIAKAIGDSKLAPRADFLAAANQHTELIKTWAPGATSLEGYLFPDTYRFSRHARPVDVLTAMVHRFGTMVTKLNIPADRVNRTVAMASLVEREVHLDAERPLVAGVFENRLAANMPLQTDPSVVYGSMLRGTWTGVIHQSELHSDSPYNTYTHTGLPPGPICNPGIAALKAALHPTQTDYLYFVATAGGATRFSRTVAEHNQNVAAYRAETGQSPAPLPAAPVEVTETPTQGLIQPPAQTPLHAPTHLPSRPHAGPVASHHKSAPARKHHR